MNRRDVTGVNVDQSVRGLSHGRDRDDAIGFARGERHGRRVTGRSIVTGSIVTGYGSIVCTGRNLRQHSNLLGEQRRAHRRASAEPPLALRVRAHRGGEGDGPPVGEPEEVHARPRPRGRRSGVGVGGCRRQRVDEFGEAGHDSVEAVDASRVGGIRAVDGFESLLIHEREPRAAVVHEGDRVRALERHAARARERHGSRELGERRGHVAAAVEHEHEVVRVAVRAGNDDVAVRPVPRERAVQRRRVRRRRSQRHAERRVRRRRR